MTFSEAAVLVMLMPVLFGVGAAIALGTIVCVSHFIQWVRDR